MFWQIELMSLMICPHRKMVTQSILVVIAIENYKYYTNAGKGTGHQDSCLQIIGS